MLSYKAGRLMLTNQKALRLCRKIQSLKFDWYKEYQIYIVLAPLISS